MTPMVDLGFLLITFFVFTAEMNKPATLPLYMPKQAGQPTPIANSNALTMLLDDRDRVYFYEGNWEDALRNEKVFITSLSDSKGIGRVIRQKQGLLAITDKKMGRKSLMLLIKAGRGASYKNVIDALDEALINDVTRYALLSADDAEIRWMKKQAG